MGANCPAVNVTKYVKVRPDQWRFCPVVTSSNRRIKPDHVWINGKEEAHNEGAYYIEWYEDGKRHRQSVGKEAIDARAAQHRQEQVLATKALGIEVLDPARSERVTLADAIVDFLEEVRQNRRPKTYHQYKTALEYFRQSCKKHYVSEVDRQDLIRYVGFLQETKGLSRRTISTKFHVVLQFLKANGITGVVTKKDRPRYVEPEPEVYSEEQLRRFFASCNDHERLLFEFFLYDRLTRGGGSTFNLEGRRSE